ncbi:hypothetical protein NP233_g12476 [Leucocoprinus birnbaumii]|uniref:Uncharacterized protein n=1 Tax=Leucocoprinus birnbaumii TaxID=56174 RepID=A0AAD5YKE3_9AGAR|nr:hypothetical protein NP233_g12476 [Leucocoprinus birnbaumii]
MNSPLSSSNLPSFPSLASSTQLQIPEALKAAVTLYENELAAALKLREIACVTLSNRNTAAQARDAYSGGDDATSKELVTTATSLDKLYTEQRTAAKDAAKVVRQYFSQAKSLKENSGFEIDLSPCDVLFKPLRARTLPSPPNPQTQSPEDVEMNTAPSSPLTPLNPLSRSSSMSSIRSNPLQVKTPREPGASLQVSDAPSGPDSASGNQHLPGNGAQRTPSVEPPECVMPAKAATTESDQFQTISAPEQSRAQALNLGPFSLNEPPAAAGSSDSGSAPHNGGFYVQSKVESLTSEHRNSTGFGGYTALPGSNGLYYFPPDSSAQFQTSYSDSWPGTAATQMATSSVDNLTSVQFAHASNLSHHRPAASRAQLHHDFPNLSSADVTIMSDPPRPSFSVSDMRLGAFPSVQGNHQFGKPFNYPRSTTGDHFSEGSLTKQAISSPSDYPFIPIPPLSPAQPSPSLSRNSELEPSSALPSRRNPPSRDTGSSNPRTKQKEHANAEKTKLRSPPPQFSGAPSLTAAIDMARRTQLSSEANYAALMKAVETGEPPVLARSPPPLSPHDTPGLDPLRLGSIRYWKCDEPDKDLATSKHGKGNRKFTALPEDEKNSTAKAAYEAVENFLGRDAVIGPSTRNLLKLNAAVVPACALHGRRLLRHLLTSGAWNIQCPFHSHCTKNTDKRSPYDGNPIASQRDYFFLTGTTYKQLLAETQKDPVAPLQPGHIHCGCPEDPVLLEIILRKVTRLISFDPNSSRQETMQDKFLDPRDRLFLYAVVSNWAALTVDDFSLPYDKLLDLQIERLQCRRASLNMGRSRPPNPAWDDTAPDPDSDSGADNDEGDSDGGTEEH